MNRLLDYLKFELLFAFPSFSLIAIISILIIKNFDMTKSNIQYKNSLYRIIIPVHDIEIANAFYTIVLEIDGERISPGRHYYDLNGTILACYDPIADGDDLNTEWKYHKNQYLYIAVTNLDAVYDRVIKINPNYIKSNIEKMPWGEKLFYANDPFGTPICFVDNSTVFTGYKNSK